MRILTYLASPYSDPNVHIREYRYQKAIEATALLFKQGKTVFSPIVHCHKIGQLLDNSIDFKYWEAYDRAFLSVSKEVVVLQLPDWHNSVGVNAEIKIAKEMGIPVSFLRSDGNYEYGKEMV